MGSKFSISTNRLTTNPIISHKATKENKAKKTQSGNIVRIKSLCLGDLVAKKEQGHEVEK